MRFRRHMELEYGLKQIDIAPLVDVVFQLLIFFMLTSSFVVQSGIKVNLPKAVTSESVRPQMVEIVISAENIVYVNGNVLSLQELKDFFKNRIKKEQSILIKADRGASLGRVVEVWDMARDAGLTQINIATTQK